jgi:hypothetical protein
LTLDDSHADRRRLLMLPLTDSYIAASEHSLNFDETPVAVVREWQWPYEDGWGVFVGSAQRHALQTVGMVMHFKSADEARAAVDDEVGRWVRSGEVAVHPGRSRLAAMTEHARIPSADCTANDNLVRAAFDGVRHTDDPQALLQEMVRLSEELDPKTEPMQRILQKLTVGAIECQILVRARILHALWPQAEAAHAYRRSPARWSASPTPSLSVQARCWARRLRGQCTRLPRRSLGLWPTPGFVADTWDLVLIELLAPPNGD